MISEFPNEIKGMVKTPWNNRLFTIKEAEHWEKCNKRNVTSMR